MPSGQESQVTLVLSGGFLPLASLFLRSDFPALSVAIIDCIAEKALVLSTGLRIGRSIHDIQVRRDLSRAGQNTISDTSVDINDT
jgi:hypothetical protein